CADRCVVDVVFAGDAVVDPTRGPLVAGDETNTQHVLHDRRIEHAAGLVPPAAIAHRAGLAFDGASEPAEVRRSSDVANSAAHRALAVQRGLRTSQHLDSLHVEQTDIQSLSLGIADDGNFVQVLADGLGTRRVRDAAHLYVLLAT